MSLATLGDRSGTGEDTVVFEVSADRIRTWSEAKRSGEARWAKHEVYSGKPVQEFIGPGLDTLNLSVRFDADRGVVPRNELRRLRKLRDTGAVLTFVVGGELVGDFVLKSLSEEWRRFESKGVLTTAIAELSLEEYA